MRRHEFHCTGVVVKQVKLASLLKKHRQNLALLIGNGINRYGLTSRNASQQNSWDALLTQLGKRHLLGFGTHLPDGISLTEFYDVLDLSLRAKRGQTLPNLQTAFCQLMAHWQPMQQHHDLVAWAVRNEVPILTTNFEHTLSGAIGARLFHRKGASFTDFYPWESYFSKQILEHPCAGFAIWHINGMQKYQRSIRLGLTHYMGAVERARSRLHKGARRLSSGNAMNDWEGAMSWMQILFHKPLMIIGLGLAENEVFLRWLLIERAKYYKAFPQHAQAAWYVHTANQDDKGKHYFLRAVGVQTVAVADYDDIYGSATWC